MLKEDMISAKCLNFIIERQIEAYMLLVFVFLVTKNSPCGRKPDSIYRLNTCIKPCDHDGAGQGEYRVFLASRKI